MTAHELNANGERISSRFAPGYFQMMADFARADSRYCRWTARAVAKLRLKRTTLPAKVRRLGISRPIP
jgi:hypothetical protein